MPRGDGTGPMGMGPMTGRGAGFCSGFANSGFGCGRGFRGRQTRFGYPVAVNYGASGGEEELKAQVKYLEVQLERVNEQLGKLGKDED